MRIAGLAALKTKVEEALDTVDEKIDGIDPSTRRGEAEQLAYDDVWMELDSIKSSIEMIEQIALEDYL